MQRVDLWIESDGFFHGTVSAEDPSGDERYCTAPLAARPGRNHCAVMVPAPRESREVVWRVRGKDGAVVCAQEGVWRVPRQWTIFLMVSSHTDIGLHNSQYIQRYNSSRFLDEAMALCDATADRDGRDRYHYVMEGTWFWENYPRDRGRAAAERVRDEYILKKKIGLCVGVAGSHTQTFGLEEMCRAAYERRRMLEGWQIDSHTMSMIDNNGMSWALVQPFAEAGYRNIIFAPNQWNPLYSTVWHMEGDVSGATWNPEAGGGGAYIDLRFASALPRVFYWQSADEKSRMLVWAGGNYGSGADVFGLNSLSEPSVFQLRRMEERLSRTLPVMEEKVPYDLWLCACYEDDQKPDLKLTDTIADWNRHWAWPRFETCGDIDQPFEDLRRRFDKDIPVLKGEIIGGWYQHPLSAAELLAAKLEADRALAAAEKAAAAACLADPKHRYPAEAFRRAWNALLWNDEHSYGTSGYQGRRVYETWMQHRDWIAKAKQTADDAAASALRALAGRAAGQAGDILVFNPAAMERREWVVLPDGRGGEVTVPPYGYTVVPGAVFKPDEPEETVSRGPAAVENKWYRVRFDGNGGIISLYDKELGREMIDPRAGYGANTFIYTKDNHKSFATPAGADIRVERISGGTRVTAILEDEASGAAITQEVFLPDGEKWIGIDDRLEHVRDMFNTNRYYRYAYYAFPWALPRAKRLCHLNGCVAEYASDVTWHGTDTYMAAHEWCCAEQDGIGVGVAFLDSGVVEFDHIHPDKTDCGDAGEGGQMYFYLANDWLQMHLSGGSELSFRFRYRIASYAGDCFTAGLPVLAERFADPLLTCPVTGSASAMPGIYSFARAADGCRLVDVKRAEDGRGLIARMYSLKEQPGSGLAWPGMTVERNTVDERPMARTPWQGFETLRIGAEQISLSLVDEMRAAPEAAAEAVIGSEYTGLIDHPRAARGEHDGHLYLLWGAVTAKDLAGYALYRGETPDFIAGEDTLIATVEPECYCVGRYSDTGLKNGTCYYYRVCAVDREGRHGPLSEVFSGRTKEV